MKNTTLSKKYLLWFFLLFPFIEPPYFQTFAIVNTIYKTLQVIAVGYFFMVYANAVIQKKSGMAAPVISLLLAIMIMLLACNFSDGNYQSTLAAYLPFLGLSMWLDLQCRFDVNRALNLLCTLLDFYVLIDILSFILFPKGMYVSQSYQAIPYVCWFMGYKNPQIRFLLPYLALSMVHDMIRYESLEKQTYLRLVAVVLATLRLGSTTGLIGAIVFLLLTFFFRKTRKKGVKAILLRMLNVKEAYILIAIVSILIIFFDFQYNFSYLIVNIFHKDLDLTNRIYVWKRVIPFIEQHFWIGRGVIYAPISRSMIGASHAHNYFLNTMYNGGAISMALLTMVWLSAGKGSEKCVNHGEIRVLIFMAIVFMIMGISESLTGTVLLYPILILLYHSPLLVECKEKNMHKRKFFDE